MIITQAIQQVPLFADLPEEEMHALAETLIQRDFQPGDVLFYEGDIGDHFSIILEGQVDVIKAMSTPEERILAVLGPGEFVGEMSLLYRDRQRSASGRARNPVRVLEMTRTVFDALLKRQPELAFRIMQEMSLRLRKTEDATIRDLQEKNQELARAYQELKAAQAQVVEKEKMEHELRMARKIQESILPKQVPTIDGWSLAAYWQPARAVSGDFYDFIPFSDGRLGIVTGDVTDKGVPAALVMATTRSVIHATATMGVSPGQVMAQVNELLCPDMPSHMFVTCLYALLDPATGKFTFANAGHNLPMIRTASGVVELRATGMPLGLLPGMTYEETEGCISPGERMLLYSDGLVEAHNPQGEMYGFPRLREDITLAREDAPNACGALIDFLLSRLAQFTGFGWEQEDDVTMVVVERK